MLSKMKQFIRTASPLSVILAVILAISLTAGVALGSGFLGWPAEGTFQVAVDQQGNIRLLSPDLQSEPNVELREGEFLIELPSRELVAMLESAIGDLESRVSALEAGSPGGGNTGGSKPGSIVTTGLVLWLPLDEGKGTVAYDKSGFGNDGVINGATWIQPSKGLRYLSFDGSDDYIDLGDPAAFNLAGTWTMEAWVKADAVRPHVGIVTKWIDKYRDFAFVILNTGELAIIHYVSNVEKYALSSGTFFDDSTFYHVTAQNDGTDLRVYSDTTLVATGSGDGGATDDDGADFKVGMWRAYYSEYFKGIIGEVRVYNRILTPQEIEQNYLATESRYR